MNIRQIIKQSWQLTREDKLFSSLYVLGTALAVSMVMLLGFVFYIRIAPIYPEENRNRLLYVSRIKEYKTFDGEPWEMSNSVGYKSVREFLYPLETPECVSAFYAPFYEEKYVNVQYLDHPSVVAQQKFVDANFWKIYSYHFIDGKPFSEADFQSGLPKTVITKSLAKKLFGDESAVGKQIYMNFNAYTISGVVKDGSYLLGSSFASVFIPYTVLENLLKEEYNAYTGSMEVVILAKSRKDFAKISAEINQRFQTTMASDSTKIDLMGQPDNSLQKSYRVFSNEAPKYEKIILRNIVLFLIFMLIPVLNLSGFNATRMERRLNELAVRKCYGANRKMLISQVLSENFILTLIGTFIGLILSFVIFYLSRTWILEVGNAFAEGVPEGIDVHLSISLLFNWNIMFGAIVLAFFVNLLAGYLPARRVSKCTIIDTFNAINE